MYQVIWESSVEEDLKKVDRLMAKKIKERVENHLTKNPTEFGKPLKGKLKDLWSYRCFDKYIQTELLIIVVEAGSRGDIYRKLGRKF